VTTPLEHEIGAVETRLARERGDRAARADEWAGCAREAISSPQSLLGVAAIGFFLGEALRGSRRAEPARRGRRGLAGLLAGGALALVRARYGSPVALARRVWSAPVRGRTGQGT
jgi:hypothetical protein